MDGAGLVTARPAARPRRTVRQCITVAFLLVCLATILLVGFDVPTALRLPLVLLTVGAVPGWAAVSYFAPVRPSLHWIAAIGLSLAVSLVGAMVLLLLKIWEPRVAVCVLAAVCLLPLSHVLWRDRR